MAQASFAAATATSFSVLLVGSGLGLATTLQAAPFQCSINVWTVPPAWSVPTAQISFDAAAAIPYRTLSPTPPLGLGTTLQAVPFQCSVRVWRRVPPLVQ